MLKRADSVTDFRVINDGGCRRVSVFGMGWTGFTLHRQTSTDVFGAELEDQDGNLTIEVADLEIASDFVVWDEDLEEMAHYFYCLGREHGKEESKNQS